MDNYSGFVALRKGLLEHVVEGRMSGDMLSVYSYLLLKADYLTGLVWHTSSIYIGLQLRKDRKWVNRQMLKLEREGYIKRFSYRGNVSAYEVLINNYIVKNAVLIDAGKSNSINEICYREILNADLKWTFSEIKMELSEFQVSTYKDIKDIVNITKKSNINRPQNKKFEDDSPEMTLAKFFFKCVKKFAPSKKEPSDFNKWAQQFDYIIRIDKRSKEEISLKIRDVISDPFWRTVVLSPAKLRDKWNNGSLDNLNVKPSTKGGPDVKRGGDTQYLQV